MLFKKFFLRFARKYPGWILLTVVLGFSGALFNGVSTTLIVPVLLDFLGQKIDLKSTPPIIKTFMSPFDSIPPHYRMAVLGGLILLTIVLKNLSSYASTLTSSSLSRTLTTDLREAGLEILLDVDLDFYTKTKVGDLINRLGAEVGRTASAIGSAIQLIIISITILVFICLLLSISWQLTLASTVLLSLVALSNQYFISRSKAFGKQLSEMSRAYSIRVIEVLSGIRLVKATGNEEREYQLIQHLIHNRERADFRSQLNSAAIGPISEVAGIVALMMIVLLGRILFATQLQSLSAVLFTYLLLLLRLLPFISQLNGVRDNFANTAASVEMVHDFLRRDNKPFMKRGSIPYTALKKGIDFHQLSFAYPQHQALVLQEVSLHLPQGTTLALVGASGAGKSTLADLLPRFYDPIEGCITLDGRDLREFELKSLRSAMGIVSQDTFLFNDSVRNNIAYARPDAGDDEIISAAKRANAYEFIVRLPEGLDTLIGDRGVMLSGGQRQRLAIARALLQDPEILILDEATSALDTVSERLVQAAIDELSRERTTLVIAHRLSTVQKANQIAVMDQGRVVEVGKHEELLKQGGYYARLYSMQFAEQASPTVDETFAGIAQEMRTDVSATIGLLRSLADDAVNDSVERQRLIQESYSLAVRILKSLKSFEDGVKSQTELYATSVIDQAQNLNNEIYSRISHQVRSRLNPLIGFLSLLSSSDIDDRQERHELVEQAYYSSIRLLDAMSSFEESVKSIK